MATPLTMAEEAELLDYLPQYVRRLVKAGSVRSERAAQIWLVDAVVVD